MSERVSQTILLCEDDLQEHLVRYYIKKCGLPTKVPLLRVRNASREVFGGNVNWVLSEFPKELAACRQRHKSRANTLLIVVVDADEWTVAERRLQLDQQSQTSWSDPLVVLIPKQAVETWIRAALHDHVNETDDYKTFTPNTKQTRSAAIQIHAWHDRMQRRDRPVSIHSGCPCHSGGGYNESKCLRSFEKARLA